MTKNAILLDIVQNGLDSIIVYSGEDESVFSSLSLSKFAGPDGITKLLHVRIFSYSLHLYCVFESWRST